MASPVLTIKRQNHRLHPCESERKPELLKYLLARNDALKILVAASEFPEDLHEAIAADNVTVITDDDLESIAEARYDMLISFDLPESAVGYIRRLTLAKTYAVVLLEPTQQKRLYPIETFLGRTLREEIIGDFAPQQPEVPKAVKEKAKREAKRPGRPQRSQKPKTPWEKKKKESRYLGKDENGKPIFSGKSGERNHRYDGTPRSEEEKGQRKSYGKKHEGGAEKSYEKKPRRDFDKRSGERKPKPFDSKNPSKNEGRPVGKKPSRKIKLDKVKGTRTDTGT